VSASVHVTICNKKGLHARAAAKLVKAAVAYPGTHIKVTRLPRAGETAPPSSAGATSILGLLMLAAENGVEVELQAEGADSERALADIAALIARKFDEAE
jgi:phosphocarrier protein